MKPFKSVLFIIAILLSITANAQEKKEEKDNKWDVSQPQLPFTETTITTNEGTWMSLDVSPDGQTIIFDMLGDIYSMPITDGKAKILREGHAYETQPRFSPDGKQISFTSDAGGGDNIWIMDTDGQNANQITKEDFRLVNNAVWTPDGEYIVCKKHFSSRRSLGAGEIWMYHKSGGKGLQITKRKNDQQDVGEPWVSPDGRYIYFSEDMYPGGYFQYNKDPNKEIYAIRRYDIEKGTIEKVTGGSGGAVRPIVSHNGNLLAFVKRVREKSVLYLHDLGTGEEWPLWDGLSKDQQEAWAIFGAFTGFNWTPDDKHIVIWSNGKINKVDVSNGTVQDIPFTATAKHKIVNALRFKNDPAPNKFEAKAIRQAVTSPDGTLMIFNAAGYLWKKTLPNGKPERLTNSTDLEYEPTFSRDGKYIAYVTWNDESLGAIMRLNTTEKNTKPIKLTTEKGIYREPSFSPINANHIVYRKEGGNTNQGYTHAKKAGIYILTTSYIKKKGYQSNATFVIKEGQFPQFNKDATRVYYQAGGYLFGSLTKTLKSCKPDGEDIREHVSSKYAHRLILSPNEEWVAFTNLYKVYITPIPNTGQVIDLDGSSTSIPVSQVAKNAGINLHWSSDSKALLWTLGSNYYKANLKDRFLFVDGAPDSLPPLDSIGTSIELILDSDKPDGTIAFINARIITMNGNEVIDSGTIVVNGNIITAVGKKDVVEIPSTAKVFDCKGMTIMPGLVDAHAHLGQFRYGLSPQKHWQYYANLAFGVTTTHDPSANTEMVFSQSEMVKAGTMVGPRIFSTGIILYGADGDFKAKINSLDDARFAINRTKAFGAFSVKSYNQPRRDQRQQVIKAAHEQKVEVVPEGGSTFFHNMSMILDGHTGIEHNVPVAPLFDDVVQLWSASKTGYTPTLIVNYAGISGENYWYQHSNVWENKRLLKFTPRSIIDSRSRHRIMIPKKEYVNGHILTSKSCKKLSDMGVKVNLGAHGQLQGLGAHWELWMLAQGGMSNHEALRSATYNGAYYLGMEDKLGSLEQGKLADLIIMTANPLEEIKNSVNIKYTMVNGRLYDSETMNEVGNESKLRGKFYWENNKYTPSFDWHELTNSGCVCETVH